VKRLLSFLLLVLFPLSIQDVLPAYGASKSKKSSSKSVRKKARRKARTQKIGKIILGHKTIYRAAKEGARRGPSTKLDEIDILTSIFRKYKYDRRLRRGRKKIVITGHNFAKGYRRAKPFLGVKQKEKKTKVLYKNFRAIELYYANKRHQLRIRLKRAFAQEIPHTFGAKIDLRKNIRAVIRSNREETITEIVFANTKMATFRPPGIAFFIPEVSVQLVSLIEKGDALFGYVIGHPVGKPKKFVAVRLNLTTCAKNSIKTYKLTAKEYRKKLANVNYIGFL